MCFSKNIFSKKYFFRFSYRSRSVAFACTHQGLLPNHGRRRESPAHQLWGVSDLVSWKNPVAKRLEATGSPGRPAILDPEQLRHAPKLMSWRLPAPPEVSEQSLGVPGRMQVSVCVKRKRYPDSAVVGELRKPIWSTRTLRLASRAKTAPKSDF